MRAAIAAMAVLFLAAQASAAEGIRIRDGDTLVMPDRQAWRLAWVQAPERKQAGYDAAKQALYGIAAAAGEFTCTEVGQPPSYDRLVGVCKADGFDVGEMLLRKGVVCTWKQYGPPPSYLAAELEAKSRHAGMWALPRVERNRVCR